MIEVNNKKDSLLSPFRCVVVLVSCSGGGGASGATFLTMKTSRSSQFSVTAAVSTSKLDVVVSPERSSLPHDELSSTLVSSHDDDSTVILRRKKSSTAGANPIESRSQSLKKYSQSSPAIPQLQYDLNNLGRSKSRQKKFLRLFPNVPRDEKVLNRKFYIHTIYYTNAYSILKATNLNSQIIRVPLLVISLDRAISTSLTTILLSTLMYLAM